MGNPVTALAYEARVRRKIMRGIDTVANAVRVTLGPLGRNVALSGNGGVPSITHDGATVAQGIECADILENLSARLLRHAAKRTREATGDGATTTVVLMQAIVKEGLRQLAVGANPVALRRGIERAAEVVDEELRAMAVPAQGRDTYEYVARTASSDPEIGRLLADAMATVGIEGTIAIIEGRTSTIRVEYSEGLVFDRGFVSPYFVTNAERMEAVVDDPAILLTDQKMNAIDDLVPILQQLVEVGKREVVVIARDVEDRALGMLVQNKLRGVLNVLAVKAPEFDERRTAALDDMALATGATLLAEETGRRVAEATLDDLGRARQVISGPEQTTIVGGRGDPETVRARICQIKNELQVESVRFNREKLQARLVRLSGHVAEIRVGAPSELELKEKKARLEDGHNALRAAVEHGVVPGGGVALLAAASCIDRLGLGGEEAIGAAILGRALEQPLRQLAENAGEEGSVIVEDIRRRQQGTGNRSIGYDLLQRQYVDVTKAGIIDPVRVIRSAVANAASTGAMLLTTEVLVAQQPIDENKRRRKQSKPWPGLAAGH
jgi:chaperonin GroEL